MNVINAEVETVVNLNVNLGDGHEVDLQSFKVYLSGRVERLDRFSGLWNIVSKDADEYGMIRAAGLKMLA